MTSQRGFFTRHAHSILTASLALALVWSLSGRGPPPPPIASPFNHGFRPSHGPEVDAAAFFKNLFAPLVHRELAIPPTYLSDITNKTKTLSYAGEPVWKEPLGKELLILDLDTRAFDGSNRLLHDGSVAWEDMERSSAGILNHYMYSLIHNYDYKFIRAALPTDRFASWTKPSSIASVLRSSTYRFVIFADADAIFNHPQIPLESLFNHWNVSTETSLAISLDPSWCKDSHGRVGLNTGFIIAQNNERTHEILDAWSECADGTRWAECVQYKNKKVFEQTAFNEYVRYDYKGPEDIRALPCDETDGYPGTPDKCDGEIVRHWWREKGRIKGSVEAPLERAMAERLRGLRDFFYEHRDELYVED